MALTEWERAEQNMAQLFSHLVGNPGVYNTPAAAKAYGSIESSSARIRMVRAAAEAFFGQHYANPKISKPLSLLLAAHEEASHRRNEVAHGVAHGPVQLNSKPLGTFLVAPNYHTDRNAGWLSSTPGDYWSSVTRSIYRYNERDLSEIADKFNKLSWAILHYIYSIQPFATPDGQVTPYPNNVMRVLLEESEAKQKRMEKKPSQEEQSGD
jgi:hypothetical protein